MVPLNLTMVFVSPSLPSACETNLVSPRSLLILCKHGAPYLLSIPARMSSKTLFSPLHAIQHRPRPGKRPFRPAMLYFWPHRAVANVGADYASNSGCSASMAQSSSRRFGCTTLSEDPLNRRRWDSKASSQVAFETATFLKEGAVLEFRKDSGSSVLGVAHSREGKRNWSVIDQNGETYTVRPNQIKFIVPGAQNLCPADLNNLLRNSELAQDPFLLEIAWEELIMKNKTVSVEELSLILYGDTSPAKCYSAYQMLSSNPVFFSCKVKGYFPVYEPRPLTQVKELQLQKSKEATAQKELMVFVNTAKSAMQQPFSNKPPHGTWILDGNSKKYTDLLRAYALEACKHPEEKSNASQILDALGVEKSPSAAVNALIQIGYFPMHINLELLKSKLPLCFPANILAAAEALALQPPCDFDKVNRVDLTSLKVYTIDSDDADEIDDGLSALKLPDGRLKLWIHVADPTRWVGLNTLLRKEASIRSTSVYLPTETIPMFPMELSRELMSLRQGVICPAVSVSAILSQDGSIAESTVENSIIRPTYKLSYHAASELLSLKVEEEEELSLLLEASKLRNIWRLSNGATDLFTLDTHIRVKHADSTNPVITLSVDEELSPAMLLVSEMMILCGEAIATFGENRGLSLPYRGQSQVDNLKNEMQSLPEGPARSMAMIRIMSRAEMSFVRPLQHSCLGLSGYVQFTSPIRRYADLLTHYQVKAVIRGEDPPLSSGHLEAAMVRVNSIGRITKKIQMESERYWMLVYLQQQPRERKYRAVVLRYIRSTEAVILLLEVGIQAAVELNKKAGIGEEIFVSVKDAQPRKDAIILKEA